MAAFAGPMVRIRLPPAASLSHRCLRWQQAQTPGFRRECEPGRWLGCCALYFARSVSPTATS